MGSATMATERHGFTAIDTSGNVVTPCLTREQAMTLVNTMQANGIVVRIHPALDDTDG